MMTKIFLGFSLLMFSISSYAEPVFNAKAEKIQKYLEVTHFEQLMDEKLGKCFETFNKFDHRYSNHKEEVEQICSIVFDKQAARNILIKHLETFDEEDIDNFIEFYVTTLSKNKNLRELSSKMQNEKSLEVIVFLRTFNRKEFEEFTIYSKFPSKYKDEAISLLSDYLSCTEQEIDQLIKYYNTPTGQKELASLVKLRQAIDQDETFQLYHDKLEKLHKKIVQEKSD